MQSSNFENFKKIKKISYDKIITRKGISDKQLVELSLSNLSFTNSYNHQRNFRPGDIIDLSQLPIRGRPNLFLLNEIVIHLDYTRINEKGRKPHFEIDLKTFPIVDSQSIEYFKDAKIAIN